MAIGTPILGRHCRFSKNHTETSNPAPKSTDATSKCRRNSQIKKSLFCEYNQLPRARHKSREAGNPVSNDKENLQTTWLQKNRGAIVSESLQPLPTVCLTFFATGGTSEYNPAKGSGKLLPWTSSTEVTGATRPKNPSVPTDTCASTGRGLLHSGYRRIWHQSRMHATPATTRWNRHINWVLI